MVSNPSTPAVGALSPPPHVHLPCVVCQTPKSVVQPFLVHFATSNTSLPQPPGHIAANRPNLLASFAIFGKPAEPPVKKGGKV